MKTTRKLLTIVLFAALALAPLEAVVTTQPVPKWQAPFKSFVAGTGIVESETTDIPVGTPVSGMVKALYVDVGQRVKRGDPLFSIDDSDVKLKIPEAEAAVESARAVLKKQRDIYNINDKLHKNAPGAISEKEYEVSVDDYHVAQRRLDQAEAALKTLRDEIARRTVRAPVDGVILQCRMRPGSYMQAGTALPPQLVMGSDTLQLRVDVDEYDAWRVKAGARAVAFVRGHPAMQIALHYRYTEPLIVPKRILNGRPTERTDTRVLQVVYGFERPDFALYAGQTMDVFIEDSGTRGE